MNDEQDTGVVDEVIEDQEGEQQQQADEPELEEITIGDAEAPAANEGEQESKAIRQVREAHREEQRKRKELERKVSEYEAKAKPVEEAAPVVGAKPKLEDFDFDSDQYEAALEAWHEKRSAKQAHEAKQRSAQEAVEQDRKKVFEGYQASAAALPVDKIKFQAAEKEVGASFSPVQQAVLLASPSAARIVYAVGNNPDKLESLAKIKDPIAPPPEISAGAIRITPAAGLPMTRNVCSWPVSCFVIMCTALTPAMVKASPGLMLA